MNASKIDASIANILTGMEKSIHAIIDEKNNTDFEDTIQDLMDIDLNDKFHPECSYNSNCFVLFDKIEEELRNIYLYFHYDDKKQIKFLTTEIYNYVLFKNIDYFLPSNYK